MLKQKLRRIYYGVPRFSRRHLGRLKAQWSTTYGPTWDRGRRLAPSPFIGATLECEVPEHLMRSYADHRFGVLGTGWARVTHGASRPGHGSWRYGPYPPLRPDTTGAWLTGRVNSANLERARAIWSLIGDNDYEPIDWQLDMRSGFRWSEGQHTSLIEIGMPPGADVKNPWELARMLHLPQMALYATGHEDAGWVRREIRAQILDFVATNPPGFGVNWKCAIDVGIRAANLAMTAWVLESSGRQLEPALRNVLACTLDDHARWIEGHLEWGDGVRSNHYLANIVGLLFATRALASARETSRRRAWARRALIEEFDYLFAPDGSEKEGSTAYHRFGLELVVWGTAVILADNSTLLPHWYASRVLKAIDILSSLKRPDGRIPQIGDNDSGRLFRLSPRGRLLSPEEATQRFEGPVESHLDGTGHYWAEDHLDPDEAIDSASSLFLAGCALSQVTSPSQLVFLLAAGRTLRATGPSDVSARKSLGSACGRRTSATRPPLSRKRVFRSESSSLRAGLRVRHFRDMGIIIFKGPHLYLLLRCEERQPHSLVHRHNDQLSMELWIDGCPIAVDPGIFSYTGDLASARLYKSVYAHDSPWPALCGEPLDLFQPNALRYWPAATIEQLDATTCTLHYEAVGRTVMRRVAISDDTIVVEDYGTGTPAEPTVHPCSGYGEMLQSREWKPLQTS